MKPAIASWSSARSAASITGAPTQMSAFSSLHMICMRLATLQVSPTAAKDRLRSLPTAPITTGPYWQPMRMSTGVRPAALRSRFQSSSEAIIPRAALSARAASSGAGRGTPNVAMMQSPI